MANTKITSDQALRLDRQLCFALHSASLAMTKVYKPHLDTLGLTYPQYLVMLVLWVRDGRTVSDIGEHLFLDSGTLTPLLKRLESAGLLTRQRDDADERRVLIHLSHKGRALKSKALGLPHDMLQAMQCSVSEATHLTRQLQSLRAQLLA
jgi:DNA-binding MarR family transcriptional regulator